MRKLKNEELGRLSNDEFQESKKWPLVIVLDNIRSMHNVGATFRTSDAFRIEKIYLTGITAKPPHREINKAALGSTETVTWVHYENPSDAIADLKARNYKIIAIEQADESQSLANFHPENNAKYALVFGNEVFGVTDEVIAQSDVCLEIPQFGTKHSLNVSVSVGLVVWDFYSKQRPSL